MFRSQITRRHRALQLNDSLKDHAAELLILLELDEMPRKKMPIAPSEKILDELQQLAMAQFKAYQGRVGKLPD